MTAQRTHPNRFPGETSQYRAARNKLLTAERDLRRTVERVAEMRRSLPLGGTIPKIMFLNKARRGSMTRILSSRSSFQSYFETA